MEIFDKIESEDMHVYKMTRSKYEPYKKWGDFMRVLESEAQRMVIDRLSSERKKEIVIEFEKDSYILSRSFVNILKDKKTKTRIEQIKKESEIEDLVKERLSLTHNVGSIAGLGAGIICSLTSYLVLEEFVPNETGQGIREFASFFTGLFMAKVYYQTAASLANNFYLNKLINMERQKKRLLKLEGAYQDLIDSTERRL